MKEATIVVGTETFVDDASPSGRFGVVFEDDGDTGYLYALALDGGEQKILDAMHIYDVAQVVDRNRPSMVSLVWKQDDGERCAFFINGFAHAVFDFGKQRGWCRTGFPRTSAWSVDGHGWSDEALEGFT